MIKKSTRNSEKVKDVEVDMIERSIQMEEEAKTKIHEISQFEKSLKVKITKVKSKELVLQFFGVLES